MCANESPTYSRATIDAGVSQHVFGYAILFLNTRYTIADTQYVSNEASNNENIAGCVPLVGPKRGKKYKYNVPRVHWPTIETNETESDQTIFGFRLFNTNFEMFEHVCCSVFGVDGRVDCEATSMTRILMYVP